MSQETTEQNTKRSEKKIKLTFEITEELFEKLKYISENPKKDIIILNNITNYIETTYDSIVKNSLGFKVKDIFIKNIDTICNYNAINNVYNITKEAQLEIQQGNLKKNIKGTINTCPISDDYVISYEIQKNIKVKRYIESIKEWEVAPSYNINIKTYHGDFVYISALNTIKTAEKYKEYMEAHPTE